MAKVSGSVGTSDAGSVGIKLGGLVFIVSFGGPSLAEVVGGRFFLPFWGFFPVGAPRGGNAVVEATTAFVALAEVVSSHCGAIPTRRALALKGDPPVCADIDGERGRTVKSSKWNGSPFSEA
jgi:hypothetical protein